MRPPTVPLIAALVATPFLALAATQPPPTSAPVLINESASLPRGLYLRLGKLPTRRGEVVATRQPERARRYLAGLGMPSSTLLLKRVAALPGDQVCAGTHAYATPVRTVSVLARDRRGAALPHGSGCRRLGPDELVLLGDTPTSFDSRYFGPVARRAIRGVYTEVLTW